jgi:hypothetical protein
VALIPVTVMRRDGADFAGNLHKDRLTMLIGYGDVGKMVRF